jgi:hypothetical protein
LLTTSIPPPQHHHQHAHAGDDWKVYFNKLKMDIVKVFIGTQHCPARSSRRPLSLTPVAAAASSALPVIQTQEYYKSENCLDELGTALEKRKNRPKIIPLRYELNSKGEDNPTVEKDDQWPPRIKPVLGKGGFEEKDCTPLALAQWDMDWAPKPVVGKKKNPNDKAMFKEKWKEKDMEEALEKWQKTKAGRRAVRRALVQDEMGKINSQPSRGVMDMSPGAEGMGSASGVAEEVLGLLTESMNAYEKKGYMARLDGMNMREKLIKDGAVRETNALDKKIYFSAGRNIMPWRATAGSTEMGLSAFMPSAANVIELLAAGGDPSEHGEQGTRAIHWSISKQCDDCFFTLVGGGADIQKKGWMVQSGLLVMGAVSQMRCCLLDCVLPATDIHLAAPTHCRPWAGAHRLISLCGRTGTVSGPNRRPSSSSSRSAAPDAGVRRRTVRWETCALLACLPTLATVTSMISMTKT